MSDTKRTDWDEAESATAHLPGLDIEIVHRRSPDGAAEQISVNFRAVPSFEAFGRFVEPFNPFAFWAGVMRLAWLPWLGATGAGIPSSATASRPVGQLESNPRGND